MKFNIEVEVDWLGEDGDLDDAVKERIVDGVVGKLSKGVVNGVTETAMKSVQDKIGDLVTDLFDGFINRGVNITDRYGDVVKENVSIESLLKERLDKALQEQVNGDGKVGEYGNKMTRLDYMLDTRVKTAVSTMTKDVIAKVDAKIAEALKAEVKAKLGESLLSKVDVDGITAKALEQMQK